MRTTRHLALLGLALMLATAAAQADPFSVRAFVRGSWSAIRTAHQARPTIVHLWGLTCAPCRVEMPEWGKLLATKPAVDIVMLHAERMPPDPSQIEDMLTHSGLANAENWAFGEVFSARLRYEIDPKWQGELPMTLLIGRDGTIRSIVGSADIDTVRDWIAAEASPRR